MRHRQQVLRAGGQDHVAVQLGAELFDVTTGQPVLVDSYEIKGDPARMAPIGAHMFAQRVEKTINSLLH